MSLIVKINRIYEENVSQQKQILKFDKCKIKFRRTTQTILIEDNENNAESKRKSDVHAGSDQESDQENENLLSEKSARCKEVVFLLGSEIGKNESLKIECYKRDGFFEKFSLIS
jgi:hypothetical protein